MASDLKEELEACPNHTHELISDRTYTITIVERCVRFVARITPDGKYQINPKENLHDTEEQLAFLARGHFRDINDIIASLTTAIQRQALPVESDHAQGRQPQERSRG